MSLSVWEESGKVFAALNGSISFRASGSIPLFFTSCFWGGGGKKRRSSTGTLGRVCLYQALVFLFLELLLHDPGFLSQLLAQGQILNLGLDNKSTAEVNLTLLKRLSAL